MAPDKRTLVAVGATVVAVVVILGVAAWWFFLRPQDRVEIVVQDVIMLANRPMPNETELHVYLMIRNPRATPLTFTLVSLWAWDPDTGTLYDTYAHENVVVEGRQTWTFSEVSALAGLWSVVAFQVKVFTSGGSWESNLAPGQPIVYPYA
ncbi:MAG: hypothetical protein WC985_01405 [Thermoplasmata archaeon]